MEVWIRWLSFSIALSILTPQKWLFWGPRPQVYRFKTPPLECRRILWVGDFPGYIRFSGAHFIHQFTYHHFWWPLFWGSRFWVETHVQLEGIWYFRVEKGRGGNFWKTYPFFQIFDLKNWKTSSFSTFEHQKGWPGCVVLHWTKSYTGYVISHKLQYGLSKWT